jgi:ABC-type uncharacterized transport system YnjBCD substrate-binding protein
MASRAIAASVVIVFLLQSDAQINNRDGSLQGVQTTIENSVQRCAIKKGR